MIWKIILVDNHVLKAFGNENYAFLKNAHSVPKNISITGADQAMFIVCHAYFSVSFRFKKQYFPNNYYTL